MTTHTAEKPLLALLAHPENRLGAYDAATRDAAAWAALDAIGLGLGTYDHEVHEVAARYAALSPGSEATIWSSGEVASVDAALVANGASVRCFDYNDVLRGTSGQGGHPGDIVPALFAISETTGASGHEFLDALTAAYDASRILFDAAEITSLGWDYVNLTGLAAIVGISRLERLTDGQVAEALGIYAASRLGTNQYESGHLTAEGNFPNWKRLNGGESMVAAHRAVRLAKIGAEGPALSLLGPQGFFAQQGVTEPNLAELETKTGRGHGVAVTEYKRWPIGTMAHSAILAALELRSRGIELEAIARMDVLVDEDVVGHLVREAAWDPQSRETADHSLPYIVAVAMRDGDVTIDQFSRREAFAEPRMRALLPAVHVTARPREAASGRPRLVTEITVTLTNGTSEHAVADFDPMTLQWPAVKPILDQKLALLAQRRYSADYVEQVRHAVLHLTTNAPVDDVSRVLRDRQILKNEETRDDHVH